LEMKHVNRGIPPHYVFVLCTLYKDCMKSNWLVYIYLKAYELHLQNLWVVVFLHYIISS